MSDRPEDRTADDTTMAGLAGLLGIPDLDDAERTAVLDLTRVVAHTVQRRFGPLAAYAVGLAADEATEPAERLAVLRRAVDLLESRDQGAGPVGAT